MGLSVCNLDCTIILSNYVAKNNYITEIRSFLSFFLFLDDQSGADTEYHQDET